MDRYIKLGLIIVFVAVVVLLVLEAHVGKKFPSFSKASDDVNLPSQPAIDMQKETPKTIIKSPLAERGWYSADANALRRQIEGYFSKADVEPNDETIALILPHAGYAYSGPTAAFGLKTAGAKYSRVVVIGPSHQVPMENILSVSRATHYQTVLGDVPLDVDFISKLLRYPIFQSVSETDRFEHSVQIEVPLLQYRLKDFRIVPIVAGQCSSETIKKAADILKSLLDDRTLVVASSDFTHFGPNYGYVPFKDDVPAQIKKLDMGAYEHIAALDSKGFTDYLQKTGATVCGSVPIAILLSTLGKDTKADLIKYATSGEQMGDFTNSVSYLSVAFHGHWSRQKAIEPPQTGSELTEADKKYLLTLARRTIVYFLEKHQAPTETDLGVLISESIKVPRAAFVTLQKHSQLRGCIGDIFPRQPLYKSVISNAVNAAVNDWRFTPVTIEECNDITIEISALTIPAPIDSWKKIRIGTDGVVLKKQGRSAVFLPQVAPEQGWDINTMLTQLSIKAGLPSDAWKQDAEFLIFQAEVFGEKE